MVIKKHNGYIKRYIFLITANCTLIGPGPQKKAFIEQKVLGGNVTIIS